MHNPTSIFTGISDSHEPAHSTQSPNSQSINRVNQIEPSYAPSEPSDHLDSTTIHTDTPQTESHRPYPSWVSESSGRSSGLAGDSGETTTDTRNGIWPKPAKRKRSTSQPETGIPSRSDKAPLTKRRRRKPYDRARHTVDHFDLRSSHEHPLPQPLQSPLFFSYGNQNRPKLPARFSSSEAGARMLSKARGDDGNIKTVTLARGTFGGASPPIVGNTPLRASSERSSVLSDSADKSDVARMIASIGVGELLEADARPSFILDLVGSSSAGATSIRTVFANAAFRANSELYNCVLDKRSREVSPTEASSKRSSHFKAWILSGVAQGEASDAVLPSFEHAGYTWSCTTLRKRLRVFSGTRPASLSSDGDIIPTYSRAVPSIWPLATSQGPPSSARDSIPTDFSPLDGHDPGSSDYFGLAVPDAAETEVLPDAEDATRARPLQTHTVEPPLLDNGTMPSLNADHGVVDVTSFDNHPSLNNECVLRAATAGDVDWFSSKVLSPHRDFGGFFDWTQLPISDDLPRHIKFARSIDWASTSLGPIEYWSSDLRQMCNLIMASPHPAAMYWGDDLIAIYNEAYVLLAGQKHPQLMGQSYREAWAEIWDDVKDAFAEAKLTGQATMKDDDCLFIRRSDWLEETYFSWSIIPMVGGDGTVMGLYNPAFEKTRRKIAERRMLTLREVGERTATARDVKSFWKRVLEALATNDHDTPFALLYSVADDNDTDSASIHSSSMLGTKQCFLEGSLGASENHPAAIPVMELKTSMEGFTPIFREALKTSKPVQLKIGSDVSPAMLDGIDWRGFGDPCREIIVCPIHPTTGETVLGFLVMGINPRRPYDDDYSLFIQLLSRQLATSLASVVLFEEEIDRGQKAARLAALDRMELSEQLRNSETRFTRMAEFSPAGLFIADSVGHINYCNDAWYEVSRVSRDVPSTDRWIESVLEDDQAKVRNLWAKCVDDREVVADEFRFKAPWEDRDGNRTETWVLFSAYPETNENGDLVSVFGSIANISAQKWAEGFQRRKMEEAVELKRQQENFIDITSHEMRNPLSAILQCADEISTTLGDFKDSGNSNINPELVSDSIDSAQTIALCALHQKRIVDDVLTLSKLDSAMLHVTPVDVQPLTVVQRALKMFEGEVATADINLEFQVDKSYEQNAVDWVKLDPSRVLQVLINLTTNAIKFTTPESKRTITVGVAAYVEEPSKSQDPLVEFFPPRPNSKSQTQGIDWGNGQVVYLQFSVQDTGRGLTEEEKKLLFLRFSQASPRTHVTYGGSGLGLFISRELTELQGGRIGVASTSGKGSTFAFYVKCRKSNAPEDPADHLPVALPRQPSTSSDGKMVRRALESHTKTRDFALGPSANGKTPAPTQTRERKHIKVLIVEDNLVNQRVLQKQLKNVGFDVLVANHGGEALEQLQKSTFWHQKSTSATNLSVLLMDQEMPVMDGLKCTKKIRELEREGKLTRHVPIIAVTANARAAQIQTLMDVGMDDVVSKPFRIPDLVPKIEQLLERFPIRT